MYEILIIVSAKMSQDNILKFLENIEKTISKNGKVLNKIVWGTRVLYHKIKGEQKGNYIVIHFDFDSSKLIDFKQELNIDKDILRYKIVKTDKNYEFKDPNTLVGFEIQKEEKKEVVKKKDKKAISKKDKKEVPDTDKKEVEDTKKVIKKEKEETKNVIDKKEEQIIEKEPVAPKVDDNKEKKSFDEKIDKIIDDLDDI